MSDCSLFYLPTWYILCHYFFSSFLPSEFPESNATSADGRSSFKRGMEKRRLVWYYKTFSLLNRSYLDTAHILSIVDVFFWQKFLLLTDSDLAKDKTIFLSSSSFFSWNAVSTVFHFVADSQNPFYGNRYALGDDISTRLLFDSEGNLAGIQGTVRLR